MKILQVCQSFYPCFASGGVVRVVYDISKELVKRGHEVTVYTTDGCDEVVGDNKQSKNIEGVKVYYFKNLSRKLKSKFKITNPYYIPLIARKEIKNYDIIHIHEHRTLLAAIVKYYAKKYGIPYVVQAHGSAPPIFQKSLFKKILDKLFAYNILNGSSKVIALTEIESEQYKQLGLNEKKILIIPNGINLTEYENLPPKGNFRKKFSIANNIKLVLYLGRIDKIKGIDILIKAFYNLSNELDELLLVIVGPNSGYLSELKKISKELKLNNKILFTGPLYEKDKLEAYVDSNIYVLPSIYETMPNTVLEAYACGTQVIVTNRCGIASFVEKYGFVVEYNVNQLKTVLKKSINEKKDRKKIENIQRTLKEEFDFNKVVDRIEKLYLDLDSSG